MMKNSGVTYDPSTYRYSQDFIALDYTRLREMQKNCISRPPAPASSIPILTELEETEARPLDISNIPFQPKQQPEQPSLQQDEGNRFSEIDISVIQKQVPDQSCLEMEQVEGILAESENNKLPIPLFLQVKQMQQMSRCRILQIELYFNCCSKKRGYVRSRNSTSFRETGQVEGCGICGEFELTVTNIVVEPGEGYVFARTNMPGAHFKINYIKLVTRCGDKWKSSSDALIWRPSQKLCSKLCGECNSLESVVMNTSIGEIFKEQEEEKEQ